LIEIEKIKAMSVKEHISQTNQGTPRLLPITEALRAEWDRFVDQHPQGHLLQSWEWGELKGRAGWAPLRLALWDAGQRQILAGTQVLRRTAPHVPLRLGHLAYIPKGLLLDWSQEETAKAFFSQLHAILSRRGALALRIELGEEAGTPEAEKVSEKFLSNGFEPAGAIQPERTILVDLTPPEEKILANMKKDCRYSIRSATKKGVVIREAEKSDDVDMWYELMQSTGNRKQFGIHALDYYRNAWKIFTEQDMAKLLLAYADGKLLAGIFVFAFASKGYYLYAGADHASRDLFPNYLLLWEGMRWAKGKGAQVFDLWGIPTTDDPSDPMAGVQQFKEKWGGKITSFAGAYEYEYRPMMMKLARKFISL
jgi:lipid II:glycine glycyltransferase (peptidoglycan interpeptide bridge formation enzyme)